MKSRNQKLALPILAEKGVELWVKREDTLHPIISGNKYRKLKYNLIHAQDIGFKTLLTFGGAFSNHILAVAAAGQEHGFKTIGVIRGEELQNGWEGNPTLEMAHDFGMQFHFVSREAYRQKNTVEFLDALKNRFGDFYTIPEGGCNALGVKGCEEILTEADVFFDHICCAVGTGSTLAGLINTARTHQKVLGYTALKGDFLKDEICTFVRKSNWKLVMDYHFGGYAKVPEVLVSFINTFKESTNIPLDPIYTGKMLFGVLDGVAKGSFPKGSRILAVHTGGLQGIAGMNGILKTKNLPLLHL